MPAECKLGIADDVNAALSFFLFTPSNQVI
jgi:hypothetical protein